MMLLCVAMSACKKDKANNLTTGSVGHSTQNVHVDDTSTEAVSDHKKGESKTTDFSGAAPLAMYPRTEASENTRVFFITPQNSSVLSSPVKIKIGTTNVPIKSTHQSVPDTVYFYVLINTELPDQRFPIPDSEHYRRVDNASMLHSLDLPPGEHQLQLLLGDHLHIPHLPPVFSDPINITVVNP